MKIKVSETTPIQLDWLVAKCEGCSVWILSDHTASESARGIKRYYVTTRSPVHEDHQPRYSPSTDWAHGGPIIEEMLKSGVTTWNFMGECFFELAEENILQKGSTTLIAGLRCYCCIKFGEVVDIPEELL